MLTLDTVITFAPGELTRENVGRMLAGAGVALSADPPPSRPPAWALALAGDSSPPDYWRNLDGHPVPFWGTPGHGYTESQAVSAHKVLTARGSSTVRVDGTRTTEHGTAPGGKSFEARTHATPEAAVAHARQRVAQVEATARAVGTHVATLERVPGPNPGSRYSVRETPGEGGKTAGYVIDHQSGSIERPTGSIVRHYEDAGQARAVAARLNAREPGAKPEGAAAAKGAASEAPAWAKAADGKPGRFTTGSRVTIAEGENIGKTGTIVRDAGDRVNGYAVKMDDGTTAYHSFQSNFTDKPSARVMAEHHEAQAASQAKSAEGFRKAGLEDYAKAAESQAADHTAKAAALRSPSPPPPAAVSEDEQFSTERHPATGEELYGKPPEGMSREEYKGKVLGRVKDLQRTGVNVKTPPPVDTRSPLAPDPARTAQIRQAIDSHEGGPVTVTTSRGDHKVAISRTADGLGDNVRYKVTTTHPGGATFTSSHPNEMKARAAAAEKAAEIEHEYRRAGGHKGTTVANARRGVKASADVPAWAVSIALDSDRGIQGGPVYYRTIQGHAVAIQGTDPDPKESARWEAHRSKEIHEAMRSRGARTVHVDDGNGGKHVISAAQNRVYHQGPDGRTNTTFHDNDRAAVEQVAAKAASVEHAARVAGHTPETQSAVAIDDETAAAVKHGKLTVPTEGGEVDEGLADAYRRHAAKLGYEVGEFKFDKATGTATASLTKKAGEAPGEKGTPAEAPKAAPAAAGKPALPPAERQKLLSEIHKSTNERDLNDAERSLEGVNIKGTLPKAVGGKFYGHGLQDAGGLDKLLTGGIDKGRQFFSEPLSGGEGLLRDGTANFVVTGGPGERMESGGIKNVIVSPLYSPEIPKLQKLYPHVEFIARDKAPARLAEIAGKTAGVKASAEPPGVPAWALPAAPPPAAPLRLDAAPGGVVTDGKNLNPYQAAPKTLFDAARFPAMVGRRPAYYRRKEILRAGEWTHRGQVMADGTNRTFAFTPEDFDEIVSNFKARAAAGHLPYVPVSHENRADATSNLGYVVDMSRDGESLYATVQLIGDDALDTAEANDVSVFVVPESVGAKGQRFGKTLLHLAATGNPNQPRMAPYETVAPDLAGRVAASAEAAAVPVLCLTRAAPLIPVALAGDRPGRARLEVPAWAVALGADQPRVPAGSPGGGQWTAGGGGGISGGMSRLPIDDDARREFLGSGRAAAFRIHDLNKPLPKKSVNTWHGDDAEEMPGVSGHANLSNALDDMLYGDTDSASGENYTSAVRENGGRPGIVVMAGKSIDGPGAEVVVPSPKIAAVFSHEHVAAPFREEAKKVISEGGGTEDDLKKVDEMTPPEVTREFGLDRRDKARISRAVESRLLNPVPGATRQS